MMSLSYRSISFASIFTILVMTAIFLLGEVSHSFMVLLTALTGNHWVTKNFLSVILFAASLAFFSTRRSSGEKPDGDSKLLLWVGAVAVACSIVLLAFFVIRF
jgi:hypothetical protein